MLNEHSTNRPVSTAHSLMFFNILLAYSSTCYGRWVLAKRGWRLRKPAEHIKTGKGCMASYGEGSLSILQGHQSLDTFALLLSVAHILIKGTQQREHSGLLYKMKWFIKQCSGGGRGKKEEHSLCFPPHEFLLREVMGGYGPMACKTVSVLFKDGLGNTHPSPNL